MKKLGCLLLVVVAVLLVGCGVPEPKVSPGSIMPNPESDWQKRTAVPEGQRPATQSTVVHSVPDELVHKSDGVTVKYVVTGKGGANKAALTMQVPSGTSQQEVRLPWDETYTFPSGSFVYLSAQNQMDSGSITAKIYLQGKLWKEVESKGAYVIASVSGSAY